MRKETGTYLKSYNESMEDTLRKTTEIYCPNCGALAEYDIVHQNYRCSHCGSLLEIEDALKQNQGFRSLAKEKMKQSIKNYRLFRAECSGCGAEVVFEENEALGKCAFCGKSLIRREYLEAGDMPESVIPFAITLREARKFLSDWCETNKGKEEAKRLRTMTEELKGFYLPYELIRGPVHMHISRMDSYGRYECEGFLHEAFVNRSKQLDNLLLDGMEPFDTEEIRDFDFGYAAGQKVKIADISGSQLSARAKQEAEKTYLPQARRILETRAVEVDADLSSALHLPVLLPVYYLADGDLMAAVNGQTGKVSVRALKESHYLFLPWWLKAIVATLVIGAVFFGSACLLGMEKIMALMITGMLSIIMIIILLCLYSDTTRNRFLTDAGKEIFTSGEKTFVREYGNLVQSDKLLLRKTEKPVFFMDVKGKREPVLLKFTTPARVLRMLLYCMVALFLPVIIALFLNGFDFGRLELGGSAVWFCIAVPVVPVYLLKFGVVELHERPWIYVLKNGRKKRMKERIQLPKGLGADILRALFVPPLSLAVWFGILSFFVMCYLTAFGFD